MIGFELTLAQSWWLSPTSMFSAFIDRLLSKIPRAIQQDSMLDEEFKNSSNYDRIELLRAEEDFVVTWFKNNRKDPDSFASLYTHLKNRLFSLAYRYTYNREAAEDILQETFIQIYKNMSTVTNAEAFQAWIYRVTINTALSYLRRHRRHRHPEFLEEGLSLEERKGPSLEAADEAVGKDESLIHQAIEEALCELPAGLKTVFILHDVQGFTHEEIANILGSSVGTSKSQLFKARLKLREYLRKKEIGPRGKR